jgi:hypothetical protein
MKGKVIVVLSLLLAAKIILHADQSMLREDDLRDRSLSVESFTGRTAELFLNLNGITGKQIVFRDVYNENVRVFVPIPHELNLTYYEYHRKQHRILSGNEFERYGEKYPWKRVKDIITTLAGQSKSIPLSAVVRLIVIDVERRLHYNNPYLDAVSIYGVAININI